MSKSLKQRTATGALAALFVTLALNPAFARKKLSKAPGNLSQMTKDEKVLHAANRLEFGPAPGDEQRIQSVGLNQWIDEQLHPESIAESSVLVATGAFFGVLAALWLKQPIMLLLAPVDFHESVVPIDATVLDL